MGAPISDEQYKKYAPRWLREQSTLSRDEPRSVPAAPTVPLSTDVHEGWKARSKFTLWSGPERPPPPPEQLEHGALTLMRNRMGGLICRAWGIVGPLCRAAMAGRKRAPQLRFANMANL